jgi:hypothetical protein
LEQNSSSEQKRALRSRTALRSKNGSSEQETALRSKNALFVRRRIVRESYANRTPLSYAADLSASTITNLPLSYAADLSAFINTNLPLSYAADLSASPRCVRRDANSLTLYLTLPITATGVATRGNSHHNDVEKSNSVGTAAGLGRSYRRRESCLQNNSYHNVTQEYYTVFFPY